MDNPRPEKVAAIAEVKDRFDSASSVYVTEYRGLTVDALADLRNSLRESGGYYKVYKNTLVRRAAGEAGIEMDEQLLGPTALTFTEQRPDGSDGDMAAVAKTLRDFAKSHPELVIKGGYFDGNVIDADTVKQLADIEPREVLLAKLAGLMQAPMAKFAGLMQALPRDFAYGLQALIEKGGAPGAPESAPAEAEESSSDDQAADEAPTEEVAESEAPAEEPAAETETETQEEPAAEASEDAAEESKEEE
jgi:large subunit ribosomal protein L10